MSVSVRALLLENVRYNRGEKSDDEALARAIGELGDDWAQWWADMTANGLRVTASWSDTYYTDFSAPNYGGDYPIVLSYASSPPYEVIDGEPTTASMLDGCFRQVEYAGVLEGAEHPEAAQLVVDWMLSDPARASEVLGAIQSQDTADRVDAPALLATPVVSKETVSIPAARSTI